MTVSALQSQLNAAQAAAALEELSGELGVRLGEPGRRGGQPTAGYLAGSALRTLREHYRSAL